MAPPRIIILENIQNGKVEGVPDRTDHAREGNRECIPDSEHICQEPRISVLRHYSSRPGFLSFKPFHINNFTMAWNIEYEKNYKSDDPITAYCDRSMLPFLWSRKAFAKAPRMWSALQNNGMEHGWSQSYHDEKNGLCCTISLARTHCEIFALELYNEYGVLQYVLQHLCELFLIAFPPMLAKPPPVQLSTRELEIVRLCALGKTSWEIGKILKIAESTVNYHTKNLIIKFNACNKMSAVIAASKAGYL